MYYAWFEIAGFNYFGSSDKLLPEFLDTFNANLTLPGRASRQFPQFVPAKPAPASGVDIKKVLPIRKKTDFSKLICQLPFFPLQLPSLSPEDLVRLLEFCKLFALSVV